MVEEVEKKVALAAAVGDFGIGQFQGSGDFYFPTQASLGLAPEKLIVPKDYHKVIEMCYDFYQRAGIIGTVINRLVELSITDISNGQRKTSDEANEYYDAVLHRNPARLNRFIHNAALEYFLSGMVLPKVNWTEMKGSDISPNLQKDRMYVIPTFDMYPSQLVIVQWKQWGQKGFYLRIPDKDIKLLRQDAASIKNQQAKIRYDMWLTNYPDIIPMITNGEKFIEITDTDAILRKETSITPYPTPYLFNVLEGLIFKQQLRRMDFAVASRVVNAIMLVQEGDKDFPVTAESMGNLNALRSQILGRTGDPRKMERLFMLFTNHTTKISWITPDVAAMLNQDKYRQTNDEISEGLGFAKILLTGESRNAQASEVSTWAIQPMMEEIRNMLLEWLRPIYEQAAELNNFRYTPDPMFAPIRLQDFIKTAAVFAQLFKEGNISRETRDQMVGLSFESEIELMKDETDLMKELKVAPIMPYDITDPRRIKAQSPIGGGQGRPAGAIDTGGRPTGSQNVPVNNRNTGVKPKGQQPTSRVAASLEDEQLLELMTQFMEENNLIIDANEDGGLEIRNNDG